MKLEICVRISSKRTVLLLLAAMCTEAIFLVRPFILLASKTLSVRQYLHDTAAPQMSDTRL